jgi:hypothetical protein
VSSIVGSAGLAMSPPEFKPTPAKNIKVTVLARTFEKIQV